MLIFFGYCVWDAGELFSIRVVRCLDNDILFGIRKLGFKRVSYKERYYVYIEL